MRQYCIMFVAAALAAFVMPAPAEAGFGFRVNGGLAYVTYSDFNDYAKYMNDKELPLIGVTDKLDEIRWVPEINGEVLFSPVPAITIGAGAGMISGKSEFSFSYADNGYFYEHTVKAYPLSLNGYFDPPLTGIAIKPYLRGGIAAVYSKITFDVTLTAGGVTDGLDAELTTWGFEMHGGGGLRFAIFPMVSIDLGVVGRWANLKGFEGTGTFVGEETSDLYLAKDESAEYFLYGPEKVENRDEYEEASVDLSGMAVTIGVTVAF